MIADALKADGFTVLHIMESGKTESIPTLLRHK